MDGLELRLFDAAVDGILVTVDGEVRYANAAAVELLGVAVEELRDIGLPSAFEEPNLLRPVRGGGDVVLEMVAVPSTAGDLPVELVLLRDVTQQHRDRRELERMRERLAAAIDVRGDGVIDLDLQTGEAFLSESWYALMRLPAGPTATRVDVLVDRIHPDDRGAVARVVGEHPHGARVEVELRVRDGEDRWRWHRLVVRCMREDGQARLLGVQSDVEDERARRQAMEVRLQTDPLTGLLNRLGLHRRLDGRRGAATVIFIDLDDFKSVNDGYGHPVGDQLLEVVGRRLAHAGRSADVVCRWGGDEFVVVVMGTAAVGRKAAARIAGRFDAPARLGGATFEVRATLGLAHGDLAGVDALIEEADRAMYANKVGGREGRV